MREISRAGRSAIALAKGGFRVLPIRTDRGGKSPRTRWKNGGEGEVATWDPDIVSRWAACYPRDLFGVAAGETKSGHQLLVMDFDRHDVDADAFHMGVVRWLRDVVGLSLDECSTLAVRTRSGGSHLWWWADDVDEQTLDAWGNAVGVSSRSDGDPIDIDLRIPGRGYAIAPDMVSPGWHEGHYSVQVDPAWLRREGLRLADLILPMPHGLVEWLTQKRQKQKVERSGLHAGFYGDLSGGARYVQPHEPVCQGGRNDAMWRFLRSARHRLSTEELWQAAHYMNKTLMQPPLEAAEVDRLIVHAITAN